MCKKVIKQFDLKLEDWMIHEDGSLFLLEKEIISKKQVKIWVETKERTNHNRPHIHASYADKEYSIAIDSSFDLLAPETEDKFYRFIVKSMFDNKLVQEYRKAWNLYTDSNMNFIIDNGIYTATYCKS